MASEGVHRCPVGDCTARVPRERLMCARHWQLVPAKLKRTLRQAWRDGHGAGTRAHRAAAQACIRAARSNSHADCDQNLRRQVRRFLTGYRHPNHINGESWDEDDITRLVQVMRCHPHKPDPCTRRCLRCGATLAT
jgi:hypothetical protein